MKHYLDFKVGHSSALDENPSKMIPSKVPGAVQLDWAAAHNWPPFYEGEHAEDYGWMEDVFWHYTAPVAIHPENGRRIFLCGKGIDYRCRIRLGGCVLYEYEGLYRGFAVDLTDHLPAEGEARLHIDLWPVPKMQAYPRDRSQAAGSCKPAVSYGWDWHPRLVPLGICDDIWIESRPAAFISDFTFDYTLNIEKREAVLFCRGDFSQSGCTYRLSLIDPCGGSVISRAENITSTELRTEDIINTVELWWPRGHGEQPLYTLRLELLEGDKISDIREYRIGFRQVKLVIHEGGWEEPSRMPKSRSNPPATLQINGRRIFCKGSNWVPPDIFYGRVSSDDYKRLCGYALEANFNILRIWGGGVVCKDAFYELCDEIGLMVWQEFPLACNNYSDDPHYLSVLDSESRAIIARIKTHPCLALWCGGNELFNKWSGMTEQSPALRLLNKNCYELDPQTPFIMTSPLSGMAHGGYVFLEPEGREIYEVINSSNATAYTEFACPAISDISALRLFLSENELFPPDKNTPWLSHHGLDAFYENCWAMPDVLEHYFGPADCIEDMIYQSRILQAEGYKAVFEEARRQHPVCAMALNWNFNETWPTAAGNHLVTWQGQRLPSFEAVRQSLRPLLCSARNSRFLWNEGEDFEAELWVLNDSPNRQDAGTISAQLLIDSPRGDSPVLIWKPGIIPPQENLRGPTFRYKLPKAPPGIIELAVWSDKPGLESRYRFMLRQIQADESESAGAPGLNQ